MAVPTVSEFLAQYSEFAAADTALIQANIDFAALMTPEGTWGSLHMQGIMARTAELLAESPAGRQLRIKGEKRSIYRRRIEMLQRIVAGGIRAY